MTILKNVCAPLFVVIIFALPYKRLKGCKKITASINKFVKNGIHFLNKHLIYFLNIRYSNKKYIYFFNIRYIYECQLMNWVNCA